MNVLLNYKTEEDMSKVFWPWCTQSNYLLIQALSRYPSRLNPLVSPRAGNHSVVQMTDPSEADAKRSVVAQLARCTGPQHLSQYPAS